MSMLQIDERQSGGSNYLFSVAIHVGIFVLATFFPAAPEKVVEEIIEIEYGAPVAIKAPKVAPVVKRPPVPEIKEAEVPDPVVTAPSELPAPTATEVAEEVVEVEEVIAEAEPALEALPDLEGDLPDMDLGEQDQELADIALPIDDVPDLKQEQLNLNGTELAGSSEIKEIIEDPTSDIEQELAAAEARVNEQLRVQKQALARQAKAANRALEAKRVAAVKARAKALAERKRQQKLAAAKKAKQLAAQNSKNHSGGQLSGGPKVGNVRGISELKQKPGNPRPQYTTEDRLRRRQGVVIFLAYVGRGGDLTNFRLKQSSGHRALDMRTLGALRQWRFHSGQEGWVELPFRWSLDGKVQEYPRGLRRKIGGRKIGRRVGQHSVGGRR